MYEDFVFLYLGKHFSAEDSVGHRDVKDYNTRHGFLACKQKISKLPESLSIL